jgi:putative spermidine/putrescine transport system permease protein
MMRRVDDICLAVLVLIAALTVAFLVLPIVVSVSMSFDSRSYLGQFPPPGFSLQWYAKFFTDSYFLNGLKTSLILAVIATCVSTTVGVAAALVIDGYDFPGKEALAACFLSPLTVPAVVIGFGLLMFFAAIGVFDGFARLVGGHIVITVPYTVRATLASLVGIRRSLTEAALSLGASERQAFWRITVPLARTGIATGALFAFVFSMDDVAVSLFLTDPQNYTLPVAMVSAMRAKFDMTLSAAAVVLMAMTVVLLVVLDRVVGLDKVIGQGVYGA